MDDARAILGVGWAFPVGPDAVGDAALAAYQEDVRQAVLLILQTDPGERVMRPDFGAGLRALAFEPVGASTAALVRHAVERALIEWEPRIDQLTVEVAVAQGAARLDVAVGYRIRTTNTFYNLVSPFFLLEGERA